MTIRDAPSPLARHLAIAYALLIAYACLHPLTGWRDVGLPIFDYLFAPWPRYYRVEDLLLNVAGYVPLGFVLVPALRRPSMRTAALLRLLLLITLISALLSLTLETLQNYLASRVSSNVDLGCNTLGGFLGALAGMRWGHRLFNHEGILEQWRNDYIVSGRTGDAGLILLGLWLLAQFQPTSLLFESGDLRALLSLPAPVPFEAGRFMRLEVLLVSVGMLAIGLFLHSLMRNVRPWLSLLLLAGIAAKALATEMFLQPGSLTAWLTPGSALGLLLGTPLLILALRLPRPHQHALAGVSLLLATVLANLIPDNPYLAIEQQRFAAGNFLNFHGLTRVTSSVWPFAALAYLSAVGLWRGEHLQN